MGLLRKLFGKSEPADTPDAVEQAVIVYLTLTGDDFGTDAERDAVRAMSEDLDAALQSSGAGELDGHEFGCGECTIYMYGPAADALFAVAEPILRQSSLTPGAYAVRRYGGVSDADGSPHRPLRR